jgi:hypothetical protein
MAFDDYTNARDALSKVHESMKGAVDKGHRLFGAHQAHHEPTFLELMKLCRDVAELYCGTNLEESEEHLAIAMFPLTPKPEAAKAAIERHDEHDAATAEHDEDDK